MYYVGIAILCFKHTECVDYGPRKGLYGCVSFRQVFVKPPGFTAGPCSYITQLAEGYTSVFEVSSNMSLSKNAIEETTKYTHHGEDKSLLHVQRCEAH